jgi:hypothetical protein
MPADYRLEAVWRRRRRRADDKACTDARPEALRRCGGHRRRRLAGRDDGTAEAVPYAAPCIPGERALDECVGRGRTNTGPDDRQEVVSKLGV